MGHVLSRFPTHHRCGIRPKPEQPRLPPTPKYQTPPQMTGPAGELLLSLPDEKTCRPKTHPRTQNNPQLRLYLSCSDDPPLAMLQALPPERHHQHPRTWRLTVIDQQTAFAQQIESVGYQFYSHQHELSSTTTNGFPGQDYAPQQYDQANKEGL